MLLLKDNKGKVVILCFHGSGLLWQKKTVPETGYEGLACYSLELQCSSLGDPAVYHNRFPALFCGETSPRLLYGNQNIFKDGGKILIIQHGLLISCVSLELFKTRLYKVLDNLNQAPFPTKDWMKSSFKAPSGVAYSMILCRDMKGHFQESFC